MSPVSITASAQRLACISATLYLGLLPFAHITAVKESCFALLLLSSLMAHPWGALKTTRVWTVFAAWLGLALLSWQWTIAPDITVKSVWRDAAKGILAFSLCYVAAYRGLSPIYFGRGLLLASLAFSGIALYDFQVYQTWQGPHSPPRYDVSVTLLAFMAMLFLNFGHAQDTSARPARLLTGLALGLALITGMLSASRSFALALMLGALVLAAVYFRHVLSRQRKIIVGVLFIGIAAPLVLYSLANTQRSLAHTQDREILYSTITEHALKAPWTGNGFGHETNHAWYAETFKDIPGGEGLTQAKHAHNILLSYLEQLGIPGVLLILALFYSLVRPCWTAARAASPEMRRLGCAGLLLILGTLISNTFNFYFARHHLLLFMGLCGVVHGWISRENLRPTLSSD